ncbi:MAG: hypothetical protein J3Q66DRAFT_361111, partial [Benniella sp.]
MSVGKLLLLHPTLEPSPRSSKGYSWLATTAAAAKAACLAVSAAAVAAATAAAAAVAAFKAAAAAVRAAAAAAVSAALSAAVSAFSVLADPAQGIVQAAFAAAAVVAAVVVGDPLPDLTSPPFLSCQSWRGGWLGFLAWHDDVAVPWACWWWNLEGWKEELILR